MAQLVECVCMVCFCFFVFFFFFFSFCALETLRVRSAGLLV